MDGSAERMVVVHPILYMSSVEDVTLIALYRMPHFTNALIANFSLPLLFLSLATLEIFLAEPDSRSCSGDIRAPADNHEAF